MTWVFGPTKILQTLVGKGSAALCLDTRKHSTHWQEWVALLCVWTHENTPHTGRNGQRCSVFGHTKTLHTLVGMGSAVLCLDTRKYSTHRQCLDLQKHSTHWQERVALLCVWTHENTPHTGRNGQRCSVFGHTKILHTLVVFGPTKTLHTLVGKGSAALCLDTRKHSTHWQEWVALLCVWTHENTPNPGRNEQRSSCGCKSSCSCLTQINQSKIQISCKGYD